MKQVFLTQGRISLGDVPSPHLERGQILVEVTHSFISAGTEMSTVSSEKGNFWVRVMKQPQAVMQGLQMVRRQGVKRTWMAVEGIRHGDKPLGYSCAGRVVEIGEDIKDIMPGDLVACGGAANAHHAELVSVPCNLVVRVPEGLGLKEASAATVGSIALQGVRRADPRLGERVAVIGLGLLGQMTVQMLKAAGCYVLGSDLDAARRDRAKVLGADLVISPTQDDPVKAAQSFSGGHGLDAVIVTAAAKSAGILQQSMEMTRRKGRVVLVGAVPIEFNRAPFYQKELDFLISCSYGPGRYDREYEERGLDYPFPWVRWTENRNMEEVLRLAAAGRLDISGIIDKVFAADQVEQAYASLAEAEGEERPLGVVLEFPAAAEIETKKPRPAKADTKVALSATPKKSGTIGIAVIGAGGFATGMHLPNLVDLGDLYSVRAIVSRGGVTAKNAARQFKVPVASTDLEDALRDDDVDAVLICTRHNLHAEQTIRALRAGKAVLCEKPLAVTAGELEDVRQAVEETGQTLLVGFNRRFSPSTRAIKRAIKGRRMPLMMTCRIAAGQLPLDHWTQSEEGGGRIIGEGCHWLDLMQFFVGDHVEVAGVQAAAITPGERGTWWGRDNVAATITYADGSVGVLIYAAMAGKGLPKEHIEVHWDGHTAMIEDFQRAVLYGSKGVKTLWEGQRQDKGHMRELRHFARAIERGTHPIAPESQFRSSLLAVEIDQIIRTRFQPE